jgi:lipid II:glycine glycyltransferase (peptidoglycan interpeptide bridge formation enzyme)
MAVSKLRELAPGYTSEVDNVDEKSWCQLLDLFDDANIFQTWSYAEVTRGARNMSHLVLKKNGEVVALAQVRIAKVPLLRIGIAYVRWGPIWQRVNTPHDAEVFRQAIRAMRNEFAFKRGLVLRLLPVVFENEIPGCAEIFSEEGFASSAQEMRSRTILMDLSPSLAELHEGMKPHWKRELKVAQKQNLEILEGSNDELFGSFIEIYKEMVSRKQFKEPNDINQFRTIQSRLPEKFKMKIILCKSGQEVSSGLIASTMGNTSVYMFGATSNAGMKSRGSYMLQWKNLECLKQAGCPVYNLNGINPVKNPGTFKFKDDLAGAHGKDVFFIGGYDSYASALSHFCVEFGDTLRKKFRAMKGPKPAANNAKLSPKAAS